MCFLMEVFVFFSAEVCIGGITWTFGELVSGFEGKPSSGILDFHVSPEFPETPSAIVNAPGAILRVDVGNAGAAIL